MLGLGKHGTEQHVTQADSVDDASDDGLAGRDVGSSPEVCCYFMLNLNRSG